MYTKITKKKEDKAWAAPLVPRYLYPGGALAAYVVLRFISNCFNVHFVEKENISSHMLEQGVGQAPDVNQAGLTRDRNGCTQTTTGRQLCFRISCGAAQQLTRPSWPDQRQTLMHSDDHWQATQTNTVRSALCV